MSLAKKIGDEGEDLVIQFLSKLGITCTKNSNYAKRYEYDILCEYKGKTFTVEVKWDKYAGKSKNLAIEVENSKHNTPSGVNATLADIWIHLIGDDADIKIISTGRLKHFVASTNPYKVIEYGGDANAKLNLYKFNDILPQFKSCTITNILKELNYESL